MIRRCWSDTKYASTCRTICCIWADSRFQAGQGRASLASCSSRRGHRLSGADLGACAPNHRLTSRRRNLCVSLTSTLTLTSHPFESGSCHLCRPLYGVICRNAVLLLNESRSAKACQHAEVAGDRPPTSKLKPRDFKQTPLARPNERRYTYETITSLLSVPLFMKLILAMTLYSAVVLES